MNEWITILTVNFPHELAVIKTKLLDEGIETFSQDELSIQTNPFYSNTLGGVKLKVQKFNVARAIEILERAGYRIDFSFLRNDNTPQNISPVQVLLRVIKEYKWILLLLLAGIVYLLLKAMKEGF